MKFRKHFDYDVEKASDESAVSFVGVESLTVQSMAEDADINVLMERFGVSGRMPDNPRVPVYGDFSGVRDYQSALNAIAQAYDGFMELPAKVRARFNNNPQELLAFCANDANLAEAQSLGLLRESDHDGPRAAGSRPGGSSAEAGRSSGAVVPEGEVGSGGRTASPGGGAQAAGA